MQDQLEGQGLGLELTPEAKLLLAKKGYDPQLGARPLRRAIQRMSRTRSRRRSCGRSSTPARPWSSTSTGEGDDAEIVFRAIEGVEPPPVELAGSGPTEE